MIESGEFNDMPCAWLSNGRVSLAVTTGRGPRIISWGWAGGPNLMAQLPEFVVRGFSFVGGHRLWAAPESFEHTYRPDESPVSVRDIPGGAAFAPPPDEAGLVKELALALDPDLPRLTVTHVLRNTGPAPLELAPWALTMLRLGGVMVLPQPEGKADADGLLPNRLLVLWPYSDPTDPRLSLGNRLVLIDARPAAANKIGYLNRAGWLAYWLDGTLFTKRFDPRPGAAFPDMGCNAECYFDHRFIEMETLGPLVRLAPGEETRHVETWHLHADVPRPSTEAAVGDALRAAGLD